MPISQPNDVPAGMGRSPGHEPAGAAYIHLPFCRRKCQYCDFISFADYQAWQPAYLQALQAEISAVGRWAREQGLVRPLTSVFFGGGTPTLLPAADLASLLDQLHLAFGLDPAAEVTIEANPGTVSPASLATLRSAGFNRISLGLQAAQAHLLQRLGRIHSARDFVDSVRAARTAGFTRISADLMIGLPGQTLADVRQTLDLLLSLPIEHVSFYSLIIEPDTPFYDHYADHPERLPDEDLERAMYDLVRTTLAAHGLEPYEISNAARPGAACRHNLVYWRARPYYGFGVAAHSYLAGVRRGNTADLATWLAVWAPCSSQQTPAPAPSMTADTRTGQPVQPGCPGWPFSAVVSQESISPFEEMREVMLLGLRLTAGVRWADFSSAFGQDARIVFASELADLQRRGLIDTDTDGVRLSRIGLDLANQVFMAFV